MSAQNCEWVRNYLPLFLYNELSFEEEEAVQSHLGVCAECASVLESERQLHATLDTDGALLPVGLLNSCREQLTNQLVVERARPAAGLLARLRQWTEGFWLAPSRLLRPAGALALIAIGFLGGRFLPKQDEAPRVAFTAAMTEPVSTRVRRVEPTGTGRFQLVLDETRERVVSGSLDDDPFLKLVISASSDPSDAGLRGDTIEILSSVPPCNETRDALLQAVVADSNDGVRLRALEGLRPMAKQADVRRVLARVLLKDPNAGVRSKAIDMLTESPELNMNRENDMIGVFQDLMGREQNHYIRMRAQRQLQQVKASTEVY